MADPDSARARHSIRVARVDAWAPIVTAGVAVLVFLNTLGHGFVIDDVAQIRDNAWLRSFENLPAIFRSGVWDFEGRESSYYRPLMHVIYLLIFQGFGLETVPYHAASILFHAANSVLVLLVGGRLLRSFPGGSASIPALGAGLLFATHPIHTENVAWVAGMTDLSYGFFFLLALLLHLSSEGRRGLLVLLAVISFFLATLCKEPAFVFPIVVLGYERLMVRGRGSWRRAGLRTLPYAAASVFSLAIRAAALGGLAPVASGPNLPFAQWLASTAVLFTKYLGKLVYPFHLNFWHSFVPPPGLSSGSAIAGMVVIALVGVMGALAVHRAPRAAMAIMLLVAPLAPAFAFRGLNQGMENAFTERYLYLPSVGFAFLVAIALEWGGSVRPRLRPLLAAAMVVLTGIYATATVRRNPVWHDHRTLWEDAVRKEPGSAQAHLSYGFALITAGHAEEGRRHLDQALELKPEIVDGMLLRAAAYDQGGFDKKAILWLNNALVLKPENPPVRFYLAGIYERKGWNAWAVQQYRRALAGAPELAEAHFRLGLLLREESPAEAFRHLSTASQLEPRNPAFRRALEDAATP